MRVLYIGSATGNSELQRRTLVRSGHDVFAIDPAAAVRDSLLSRWAHHTGYRFLSARIAAYLRDRVPEGPFDVALVDQGDALSRSAVDWLRTIAGRTVVLCKDNPFSSRDGDRFRLLREALPSYDLFVTFRDSTADAARRAGARRVRRIFFPADEVVHVPQTPTVADWSRFRSDVSFIGTWMPERGPFIERLMDRGVPVRVFGLRWERAPNYWKLKPVITPGFLGPKEYTVAVACSKIAIGLLSKGNEDLHTTRSIEVPAIGTLLCAERTRDHLELYEEGKEAVFWNDADECADICLELLGNADRIASISAAGHERALKNGHFNGPLLQCLIAKN